MQALCNRCHLGRGLSIQGSQLRCSLRKGRQCCLSKRLPNAPGRFVCMATWVKLAQRCRSNKWVVDGVGGPSRGYSTRQKRASVSTHRISPVCTATPHFPEPRTNPSRLLRLLTPLTVSLMTCHFCCRSALVKVKRAQIMLRHFVKGVRVQSSTPRRVTANTSQPIADPMA
ncbi:hypothetical protein CC77DRAFT_871664 [Alternaria alternata]|uniref:Uncharacterized protein n=1 Tax=Alternaria alternata TaxID=5599 RepID=A0A177DRJ1_ALTAL|nr:hypothetical protein CC77DRAFT_871664 [Alternaria alternata]OAG21369.1 hypothetical protein CC77DRAFT_871664 [Alternaria alternata]